MFKDLNAAIAAYDRAILHMADMERLFGEQSPQMRDAISKALDVLVEYDRMMCPLPEPESVA